MRAAASGEIHRRRAGHPAVRPPVSRRCRGRCLGGALPGDLFLEEDCPSAPFRPQPVLEFGVRDIEALEQLRRGSGQAGWLLPRCSWFPLFDKPRIDIDPAQVEPDGMTIGPQKVVAPDREILAQPDERLAKAGARLLLGPVAPELVAQPGPRPLAMRRKSQEREQRALLLRLGRKRPPLRVRQGERSKERQPQSRRSSPTFIPTSSSVGPTLEYRCGVRFESRR